MIKSNFSKKNGFTLIELLVAISIIALLSSVVFASLRTARVKAKAVRNLQDFKAIEKALYLLADSENRTTWWRETDFGQGGNPHISDLVENTELGKFLPVAPVPAQGGYSHYEYDNDGDTFICGGFPTYKGVNIFLRAVDEDYFFILDDIVDNGDGSACGRITAHGSGKDTVIGYNIGINSAAY